MHDLASVLGGDQQSPVQIAGTDVLPSRHAVSELALGAVAATSIAAAELSHMRGGPRPAVVVDGRKVSAAFRSDRLVELDGQAIQGFAELSRFWQTRDGWVRTHANYPHHRLRLLTALGLAPVADAADVADRLGQLTTAEAEDAVVAANGVCAAVRTPNRWRSHPQGAAARALPLLSMTRLTAASPRRMPPPPRCPLLPAAGVRVLDLTRVIAGPVATATLALLGADVLRLDPPHLPELPEMHLVTGLGKRSALLDAAVERGLLEQLVADADVVATGYRPGSLDRFGLTPRAIAEIRPGVVVASLSAWGGAGPWAGLAQLQQLVNQQAQTMAGTDEMIDVLVTVFRAELGAMLLGEQTTIALQGAQRLFQVVRDDVREIFQLPVNAAQPLVHALELIAAGTQLVASRFFWLRSRAACDSVRTGPARRKRGRCGSTHESYCRPSSAASWVYELAFLARHAFGKHGAILHRRRQKISVGMSLQLLTFVAQRSQQGIIHRDELSLGVDAEVHDRSVMVQLVIAELEPGQIAVDRTARRDRTASLCATCRACSLPSTSGVKSTKRQS